MRTTTIQVEKHTKELLNELKKNYNSKTYDEVIRALARRKTGSLYGKLAKGRKITAPEMMRGLREKIDRL